MTLHPRPRRLLGFLAGTLGDAARRRVAVHLAGCQRCRDSVQGYRDVRLALLPNGDPPAPPAALFERISASRTAGAVVLLPVVLDRATRARQHPRWRPSPRLVRTFSVPGWRDAAAVLAVLAVLVALLQVPLPGLGLGPRLAAFGEGISSLWTAAFGGGPAAIERREIAPAVRPDPARMRPFTARYESRHYRRGEPVVVDSAATVAVRPVGADWQVWVTEGFGKSEYMTVSVLDGTTLSLRSRQVVGSRGTPATTKIIQSSRLMIFGDSMAVQEKVTDRFGDHPRTKRVGPDNFWLELPSGMVIDQGDWGTRAAIMSAVPLHRRWLGSFGDLNLYPRPGKLGRTELEFISYRVLGRETLPLPIGPTETWQLERWDEWSVDRTSHEYYRTSDGLLAAILDDPGFDYREERRLLSVVWH